MIGTERISVFTSTGSLHDPANITTYDCDGYTIDDGDLTIYRDGHPIKTYHWDDYVGYSAEKK